MYKSEVHGLLHPQLAQAVAYPGLGVLGCAYLGRGLLWTWKCSYKCTQALSAACSSRERLLRMRLFCYYTPDCLFLLPSIRLRKMASTRNEWKRCSERLMWSAPEEKQLLANCSDIKIAEQLDNCVTSASVSSAAHRKCLFTTLLDRYSITCKTLL